MEKKPVRERLLDIHRLVPTSEAGETCLEAVTELDRLRSETAKLWEWHFAGRANVEHHEDGSVSICDGKHEKWEPCRWRTYRLSDPTGTPHR